MSATDELRRMLDERGVEYTANERDTQWWPKDNPAGVLAENSRYPHGTLDVYGLTPEQAIAATLGSCNCTNSERTEACLPHFWTHDGVLHVELPKLPESISVRLPDQRDREVGSARVWQYTRDSGTCHPIISDNLAESDGTGEAWANCSECGHLLFVLTDQTSEPPNYCPNCGAKVVEPTTNDVDAEVDE